MTMHRAGINALLLSLVCLAGLGCRHKQVAAAPIPPPALLPVDTTAKADTQPLIQPVPVPPVPLTQVTVPQKKVKKPRRTAPVAAAPPPPVQVASATPLPEANIIGSLAPGGSDAPQQQRSAQDLINTLEKRVAALSQRVKDQQRAQLQQIRNFQHDAQTALNAGDAEGAMTLATKAKLLLDDIAK